MMRQQLYWLNWKLTIRAARCDWIRHFVAAKRKNNNRKKKRKTQRKIKPFITSFINTKWTRTLNNNQIFFFFKYFFSFFFQMSKRLFHDSFPIDIVKERNWIFIWKKKKLKKDTQMHKMQPQQHAHYLRLWRFIRNCHRVKNPSHDSPFLSSLQWASAITHNNSIHFFEWMRSTINTSSRYFHHWPERWQCARVCDCVGANDRRRSTRYTLNVCENSHLHSNMAAERTYNSLRREWKWPMRPACVPPIPCVQQQWHRLLCRGLKSAL